MKLNANVGIGIIIICLIREMSEIMIFFSLQYVVCSTLYRNET